MAALPPGSYLAVYDGADTDPAYLEAIRRFNDGSGAVPYTRVARGRSAATSTAGDRAARRG